MMENVKGFISSEMRYPNELSTRKKRFITFECETCGAISEKCYAPSRFRPLCIHCIHGGFSTEEFIKRAQEVHGKKYTYNNTVYTRSKAHVLVTCPQHGDFEQRASDHLDGRGCNECSCATKSVDYRLPISEWLMRLEAFPHISINDYSQISTAAEVIDFTCKIHGQFSNTLGSISTTQHVCAKCAYHAHQLQSVRPELIGRKAYLYYGYLPHIDMYKFGVTVNKDERFLAFKNFQLIAEGEKEYTEACRLEHKVFKELDCFRYKGTEKLLPSGNTELFKQDVLKYIIRALQE